MLARDGDVAYTAGETKWMADRIRGKKFISFPGIDHHFWVGSQDDLLDETERFVAEVGHEEADLDRVLATVMFTDIVGSTAKAASSATAAGAISSSVITAPSERSSAGSAGPRSIRPAMGSSRRSTGLPAASGPHRRSAARCEATVSRSARGLQTREVLMIAGQVGGIAVNVGARISALAAPSEVLVSQTVRHLVSGSGLRFEDVGERELKGVPDRWRLYRVVSG